MSYVFRGRLCGYICAECPEALSVVVVRLYYASGKDVTALAPWLRRRAQWAW